MNLPEEFKNRMKTMLGEEYEAFAKAFEEGSEAKGLRFSLSRMPVAEPERRGNINRPVDSENFGSTENFENTVKIGNTDCAELAEFIEDAVPWCKGGYYVRETARPGKSIYHEAGAFYLQEPSAMVVATLANVKPGEKVLDLCAAPGGKSTALGDALRGEGVLVSNEIHPSRVKILSENIERMGISNALVLNETPDKIAELFPEFFHCVVVDAPCSGEGMFRKEEAALREWSIENVEMCASRQREILKEAEKCVAPGGRLVYSTCTFAPLEDEENIAWFLKEYPEFHLAEIPEKIKETVSPGSIRSCVRIWPHKQRGEGHFAAVLVRDGVIPAESSEGELSTEDTTDISPVNKDTGSKPFSEKRKRLSENRDRKDKRGKNIALSREQRESFSIFENETLTEKGRARFVEVNTYSPKDERIAVLFGDNLYLEPFYFQGKGIKIERAGLHIGTFAKNRFEPGLALARVLKPEDVQSVLMLTDEEKDKAYAYLAGEQLSGIPAELKGWTLVTYNGYSLGFGKASGGVLKNHYPKGLRINFKEKTLNS